MWKTPCSSCPQQQRLQKQRRRSQKKITKKSKSRPSSDRRNTNHPPPLAFRITQSTYVVVDCRARRTHHPTVARNEASREEENNAQDKRDRADVLVRHPVATCRGARGSGVVRWGAALDHLAKPIMNVFGEYTKADKHGRTQRVPKAP